jgi:hypothetical protein
VSKHCPDTQAIATTIQSVNRASKSCRAYRLNDRAATTAIDFFNAFLIASLPRSPENHNELQPPLAERNTLTLEDGP